MYLISPSKPQFKANLHSHTNRSDGRLTAPEMKAAYKNAGYQILAITDHESPKAYPELTDPDFLMLTGYEVYIRPDPLCRGNVYAPEIHLNLFAKDPLNETIICFNEASTKYRTPEERALLKKAGSQRQREYTTEYINEVIQTARENGYLVSYNHPVWSMESQERVLSYEGCFSLEIMNGGCWIGTGMEYSGELYQKLLLSGRRMFVHAADDNHNHHPFDSPYSDSFVAWTMILADKLDYDSVFHAMETGEMYATMGPTFREVSFDGEMIHVECSEAETITCRVGSKEPAIVHAPKGELLTQADLRLPKGARYAQISLRDRNGLRADTRGFFRDELGLPPL